MFSVGPQLHCAGGHRAGRAGPARDRRRARQALRRIHLEQLVRGRGADALLRHRRRADRAGCRSATRRASRPSSWGDRCCFARSNASRWASALPHRRQAGRGLGRRCRRRPALPARRAVHAGAVGAARSRHSAPISQLRTAPRRTRFGDDHMVGVSPGFNSVCHMVKRVAPTQATVLFLGESGVGKEVFARMLHRVSPRSTSRSSPSTARRFPRSLVEAELFGVERGAFTGAQHSRLGRFERADGGTLFLDEIGTCPLRAQGKLLRVLQEGEIERLGEHQMRRVDVRVVAATNRRPAPRSAGRALPRGPVLPPQRVPDPHAAAARAARGHSAADEPLPRNASRNATAAGRPASPAERSTRC